MKLIIGCCPLFLDHDIVLSLNHEAMLSVSHYKHSWGFSVTFLSNQPASAYPVYQFGPTTAQSTDPGGRMVQQPCIPQTLTEGLGPPDLSVKDAANKAKTLSPWSCPERKAGDL